MAIKSLKRPRVILECGSGVSTIVSSYFLSDGIGSRLYFLEHDEVFFNQTRKELEKHAGNEKILLIFAPLKKLQINKTTWLWYDLELMKEIDQIDLLIVDGPPGYSQKYARYPALPILIDKMNDDATILVDDCHRREDRESVEKWLEEFPILSGEFHDTFKGTYVLKVNKTYK